MKKVGFFPAHPSQLWMMKALADRSPVGVKVCWYIRDKDITQQLMDEMDIPYTLVSKAGKYFLGNLFELLGNIFKFLRLTKKDNIDLWLSKYGAVNIASKILGSPNFSFNDDDADIVPFIALTSYPFATAVLCTQWTRMGKYEVNARRYQSLHELFYLHPKRFSPNLSCALRVLNKRSHKPYVLIRLSSLEAHHDVGARGISDQLLDHLIEKLENNFSIYISSEKKLKERYEKFRLKIPYTEVHHVVAFSALVVGDSQTMIAEAAVLGVPGIRISSFSGRLGYLDELERRELCWSALPDEENKIISLVDSVLAINEVDHLEKRNLLLKETEDPIEFFWENIMEELK